MKRLLFLILCNLFLLSHTFAQEYPAGLILDDETTYNQTQRLDAQVNSKADLPVAVSLEKFCPEVRHQGDIYSCVGWAVGYAGMTIQRAIHNRCIDRQLINENAHSALFVFNQVKQDCAKGARLTDALRFLKERGDCLAKEFDFDVNDCQKAPAPNLAQTATRFAVSDYLTLFESDASFETKVKQVKNALAGFKAVIIGMNVRRNFYNLANAKFWWPELGNVTPAGGHAMVVVGYDDRAGAFRLFNSWGQNWGDKGYIWVKYEHFAQFCKYAYIIQLSNTQSGMQAGSQASAGNQAGNATAETRPLVLFADVNGEALKVIVEHTYIQTQSRFGLLNVPHPRTKLEVGGRNHIIGTIPGKGYRKKGKNQQRPHDANQRHARRFHTGKLVMLRIIPHQHDRRKQNPQGQGHRHKTHRPIGQQFNDCKKAQTFSGQVVDVNPQHLHQQYKQGNRKSH